MSDKYIVIIGDIKQSRELVDRNFVQNKLRAVLEQINSKFQDDVVSNISLSLGDEFQGLFKVGTDIISIIEEIEIEMYPVQFRFGIGVGTLNVDIISNTFEMDGQAYHYARNMVELLKMEEKKNLDSFSFIKIHSGEIYDGLINGVFTLTSALKLRWTPRQREVIYEYLKFSSNQYQIAEKLNVNQSTVHRSLKASNFYNYYDALEQVRSFLKSYGGK